MKSEGSCPFNLEASKEVGVACLIHTSSSCCRHYCSLKTMSTPTFFFFFNLRGILRLGADATPPLTRVTLTGVDSDWLSQRQILGVKFNILDFRDTPVDTKSVGV